MQWTRPTWSIGIDLIAYGIVIAGILAAAIFRG